MTWTHAVHECSWKGRCASTISGAARGAYVHAYVARGACRCHGVISALHVSTEITHMILLVRETCVCMSITAPPCRRLNKNPIPTSPIRPSLGGSCSRCRGIRRHGMQKKDSQSGYGVPTSGRDSWVVEVQRGQVKMVAAVELRAAVVRVRSACVIGVERGSSRGFVVGRMEAKK